MQFEAWAEKLAAIALQETGGERFLITVICLEFLLSKHGDRSAANQDDGDDEDSETHAEEDGDGERDRSDDETPDLDDAGADWMSDQGFDRRN